MHVHTSHTVQASHNHAGCSVVSAVEFLLIKLSLYVLTVGKRDMIQGMLPIFMVL